MLHKNILKPYSQNKLIGQNKDIIENNKKPKRINHVRLISLCALCALCLLTVLDIESSEFKPIYFYSENRKKVLNFINSIIPNLILYLYVHDIQNNKTTTAKILKLWDDLTVVCEGACQQVQNNVHHFQKR